jgi:hypothetical protein
MRLHHSYSLNVVEHLTVAGYVVKTMVKTMCNIFVDVTWHSNVIHLAVTAIILSDL